MPVWEDFLKRNSVKYGLPQKQTRGVLATAARDFFRERFAGNVSVDFFRQNVVKTIAPRSTGENKPLGIAERKKVLRSTPVIPGWPRHSG